ncbi:hypothetical protein KKD03_04525 [Patescibacteria group bacterium]|nr:hypothetical protein [Patescibacteria group bacterium]
MRKYEQGLKTLAEGIKKNDKLVVLLGGSASNVEADLNSIGLFPDVIKSPPRQCLTDYVDDIKMIAADTGRPLIVVEDHSLTNGKIHFISEHFPDIEVVSIIGKKYTKIFPNCKVYEVDEEEVNNLHKTRSTPPASKQ